MQMLSLFHDLQPNNRFRRWPRLISGLLIIILLSCVGLFYFDNGTFYCSDIDQSYHITPCYHTIRPNGIVRDTSFSHDSQFLAAITHATDRVTIWDTHTGTLVHTIPTTPIGEPHQIIFSPSGLQLAVTGARGILLFDLDSSRIIYTIPGIDPQARSRITFSSSGHTLASSNLVAIRLYDAYNGAVMQKISVPDELDVSTIQFTPDGQHILMWAGNETRLWDIKTQQIVWRTAEAAEASVDATVLVLPDRVLHLALSNDHYIGQPRTAGGCRNLDNVILPTNDRFLSINHFYDDIILPSLFSTMCIWRISDGEIIWQSQAQGYCVDVSPDGTIAAVCDGGIELWHIPLEWYQ
jgi:WD40 repeat protein